MLLFPGGGLDCLFHEQSGGKPAGGVVQADDLADVPAGLAVAPGAEAFFQKKTA